MNQVTQLTQWKNLNKDERAGFDFENYEYKYQARDNNWIEYDGIRADLVYRLKIQPDNWYYFKCKEPHIALEGSEGIVKGEDLISEDCFSICRPAKPSEIPKPKRVFKDGAFYPVLTKHYERNRLVLMFQKADDLFYADGCDDFKLSELTWIGEELKIEWGEG